MANIFAVAIGAGFTWDNATTTNWSATSGGAGGFAVPGALDVAIFDTASGATGAALVSLNYDPTLLGITCAGVSEAIPVMIRSSVRGTARTITATTVTPGNNIQFQDIIGAGVGSWDFSGVLAGDGGGNTGITFQAPTTGFWVGQTGNWNAITEWSATTGGGGSFRIPLLQDGGGRFDANSFNAGSQTCTLNQPRIPGADWTGATNTPTWANAAVVFSVFGSITHIAGMAISGAVAMTFEGRGANTLTMAGLTVGRGITLDAPGGSLTFQDAFASTAHFTLTKGTLNANNFAVTVSHFGESGTVARSLMMGSGIWTLTGNVANIWFLTATNLTLDAGTSTIRLTGALSAARNFAGGSQTYYRLENQTTGAFALQITGSNTFGGGFYIDASVAVRTVLFTAGTTTTVSDMTRDAGTNVITIASITAATHTLTKTGGGVVSMDYLHLTNSIATPANTWYAGTHSTDNGGNSGWIFTDPPAPPSGGADLIIQSPGVLPIP